MKRKITTTLMLGASLFLGQGMNAQNYTFEKIATFSEYGAYSFKELNGTTIFIGSTDGVVFNLWKTDGTTAGTTMFYEMNGEEGSFELLEIINNKLIIIDILNDRMLSTDGTTAGTSVFYSDPDVYFSYENAVVVINGNQMLFMATNDNDNEGDELYITDGTSAGTSLLKDIQPGAIGSFPYLSPSKTFELNGEIFFSANDGVNGQELWKTDGTPSGTVLVKDIWPGADGGYFPTTGGAEVVKLGNKVIFLSQDGNNNLEPWITDGTTNGTVLLKDIATNPGFGPIGSLYQQNIYNDELYFLATDNSGVGRELWKTDGTTIGTVLVKDINPTGDGFGVSYGLSLAVFNNHFYFAANDGVSGSELWKSDGTTAGTVLLKDINAGVGSSSLNGFQVYNNLLLFGADDGSTGTELWKTDGTEAGTTLVKETNSTGAGYHGYGYDFDNRFFFSSNTAASGMKQLFHSDGTTIGTQTIHPGGAVAETDINYLDPIMFKNGAMYFLGGYDSGESYSEIWKISSATSSIDEQVNTSFQIFPNPANTHFSIDNISAGSKIKIYDITGKLIHSQLSANSILTIQINDWKNGVYFIQVEENGTIQSTKKLVVNK